MRLTSFGNFEPGSGIGCADCGLGAVLLPVLASSGGPNAVGVAQYDALAGGGTVGGNFERFKDGAEQGWFTDDKAGYANYLEYNSRGFIDPLFQSVPPAFIGWKLAGDLAYAVVNKMHVGNALSPLYDPTTASAQGLKSILGIATNLKWTTTQRSEAESAFAADLPRLLQKWGYKGGTVTVHVPMMVENPYFKSLGKTVWVDKATITYDGPDPDPNVIGGRMFSAGGVTWKWGGQTVAVPPTKYLMIYAARMEQPQYDERGWTMYPVYAWRALERGGKAAGSNAVLPDKWGPWVKWTGEYLNYADTGPKGSLLWLEDMSAADQAMVRALPGPSTPPSKAEWGWGKNTNMPTGAPQNPIIPLGDPRNPNPVTPTVKPWTDVTAPPPPPPSTGSQPIIGPGIPPVETMTGTLVPSVVGPGMTPDIPVNEVATAGVDAGSVGKGMGVALLGGLAVLLMLGSRPGRRR